METEASDSQINNNCLYIHKIINTIAVDMTVWDIQFLNILGP